MYMYDEENVYVDERNMPFLIINVRFIKVI